MRIALHPSLKLHRISRMDKCCCNLCVHQGHLFGCKLDIHITCFIPLFYLPRMMKTFYSTLKGLTELLVDVIQSAEPQQP